MKLDTIDTKHPFIIGMLGHNYNTYYIIDIIIKTSLSNIMMWYCNLGFNRI